ncbi:hypothetical protein CEUSTIGMA_g10964.t1, partial [Chlamydomonas eustigma]
MLSLCRQAMLGPLLMEAVTLSGSVQQMSSSQSGTNGQINVPVLSACLIDSSEAHLLSLMQAVLPADLAFTHSYPALLSALVASPDRHDMMEGRNEAAGLSLARHWAEAAGLSLARHAPLRLCLLSDMKALYCRLASPAAISTTASMLPSVACFPALGFLRLLLCSTTVQSRPSTSTTGRPAKPTGSALSSEGSFGIKASQILNCCAPCRQEAAWLQLRLYLDETIFYAALGEGKTAEQAMGEAMAAAFPEMGGVADAAGTGPNLFTASASRPYPSQLSTLCAALHEKEICNAVLSLLLHVPRFAPTLADTVRKMGSTSSDELLRSVEHLLKDQPAAVGSQSYLKLLQQTQRHCGLGSVLCPSDPHAVHQAISNVALICLAKSNNTKQKEFAGELVRQLMFISEALKQAPLSSEMDSNWIHDIFAQGGCLEDKAGSCVDERSEQESHKATAMSSVRERMEAVIREGLKSRMEGSTALNTDLGAITLPEQGDDVLGEAAAALASVAGPDLNPYLSANTPSTMAAFEITSPLTSPLTDPLAFLQESGMAEPAGDDMDIVLDDQPPVEAARGISTASQLLERLSSDPQLPPPPPPPLPTSTSEPASSNTFNSGVSAEDGNPAPSRKRPFGAFGSGRARRAGITSFTPTEISGSARTAGDAAAAAAAPLLSTGIAAAPASSSGEAAAGGQAQQVGSAASVQVALWLRLSILLPLLPIIHADRDPDSRGNLRNLLVPALVHLLLAPHIRPLAPVGSALALQQGRLFKVPNSLSRQKPSWEKLCLKYPDVAAALQAQDAAGESLQDRLSAILAALLSGGWASWLRGRQNKRLRDVAAFEGSKALQENLDRLLQQQ